MRNAKAITKIILSALICATMAISLTGCNKDNIDGDNVDATNAVNTTSVQQAEIAEGSGVIAAVVDELAYTDRELYYDLGKSKNAVAYDETVFYNGEGFQARLDAEAISVITDDTADSHSVAVGDIKDSVDKIVIGDKEYSIDDLIRKQSSGLDVVRMFAKDFGLNKCTSEGVLIERMGDVSESDDLRNLYSDRIDFDEYTACAYYFDVRMGNYDDATYDKYRAIYKDSHSTDTGFTLDGKLGVVLYYDTEGHDYFYSIVISAPSYYNDEENFEANMNNNMRKDITKCHILDKDGNRIGLTDNRIILVNG